GRLERGAVRALLREQLDRDAVGRGRQPGILQPGRLRIRAHAVLRPRRAVRGAAGDADGAVPGDDDPDLPDRPEDGTGELAAGADRAQPGHAVWDLPAAAVLPDAADRARGGGADGRLLAPRGAGAGGAAAVDACFGNACDRDLPVDVERLPVAADRDHL